LLFRNEINIGLKENCTLYIHFISILFVIIFSISHSVKLFLSEPTSFYLLLLILLPFPSGAGGERGVGSETATMWFFAAGWG